jgi:hypothetical protein
MRKGQATAGNDSRAAERDVRHGQPTGTGHERQQADDEMARAVPMQCPECGEPAANRAPTDLVPWQAHGMQGPEWSHTDGSALCPVPGPSGGYLPAQPVVAEEANPDAARLDPPPSMRHRWLTPDTAREAEPG